MPFSNIKTIFFDYDGTLHNGIKIYAPAFRAAYSYLVENNYAAPKEWSDSDISYWLGFNPSEMWKTFMPKLNEDEQNKCSKIISDKMKALTIAGKPQLYSGALDVISYLKNKGYHLIFISNCKTYYKDCHKNLFKLDRYFEEIIASEDYDFIPKHEIIKIVKHKYPKDMVMIGDRLQDMEAGRKNEMYTIGCSYGFGPLDELEGSDLIIDNIVKLKTIL